MKSSILFVDDEPQVLNGLRRMLRRKQGEWDMVFESEGQKALEAVDRAPFDLVVSDMRMPGMDGAELLYRVREKSPDTIRFILSGQTSKEAVYRALESSHKYISKPCDPTLLVNEIDKSLRLRERLQTKELRECIGSLKSLPSLPEAYQAITRELEKPEPSLDVIARIVDSDIGMASKILKIVNSAHFGLPREIHSIRDALSYLGLNLLRTLVLSVKVFSEYAPQAGFSLRQLWLYGLLTGGLAQEMIQENDEKKHGEETFLAGLLHEVGTLLVAVNFPERFRKIQEAVREKGVPRVEAEVSEFGESHAMIGAYLLGQWNFNHEVVEAVAYHHSPGLLRSGDFTPAHAVFFASKIVREDPSPRTPEEEDFIQAPENQKLLSQWTAFYDRHYENKRQ